MSSQRYVASELTHFVGKSAQTPEEQYRLLVKILTEGILRAGGKNDIEEGQVHLKFRLNEKLSDSERLFQAMAVCFCDIPLADLTIHAKKYSGFALAFRKEFLIKKGAAPVFYVPKGVKLFDQKTRADWLDEAGSEYADAHRHSIALGEAPLHVPEKTPLGKFLDYIVLSYLKPFNETTGENDPENYYMEREWRTLTSVRFALTDVHRVIILQEYAHKFRCNVPMYTGQVTFIEA